MCKLSIVNLTIERRNRREIMNPAMIEYLYAAALRLWPDILSVVVLTMLSGMIAIAAAGWPVYILTTGIE